MPQPTFFKKSSIYCPFLIMKTIQDHGIWKIQKCTQHRNRDIPNSKDNHI